MKTTAVGASPSGKIAIRTDAGDASAPRSALTPPPRRVAVEKPVAVEVSLGLEAVEVELESAPPLGADGKSRGPSTEAITAPPPARMPVEVPVSSPDATSPEVRVAAGPPTSSNTPSPATSKTPTGTGSGSHKGLSSANEGADRPSFAMDVSSQQLAAYRQTSALVRILSPFIEDPRPHWQLFLYFLVGIGLGLAMAFLGVGAI